MYSGRPFDDFDDILPCANWSEFSTIRILNQGRLHTRGTVFPTLSDETDQAEQQIYESSV